MIQKDQYTPASIESSETLPLDQGQSSPRDAGSRKNLCLRLALSIASIAVAVVIGFSAGVQVAQTNDRPPGYRDTVPRVPLRSSERIFQLDKKFMSLPPEDGGREPAWDTLIPKGLGYVKNPAFAPETSIVSVFHQLHCLYTLRRIYYSRSGEGVLEQFDFGLDREPHVAHCFEYLRQSLMCCADSSLEPPTKLVDGFPGWGFKRQCKDFGQLGAWAERWRVMNRTGFLAETLAKDIP